MRLLRPAVGAVTGTVQVACLVTLGSLGTLLEAVHEAAVAVERRLGGGGP